MRDIIVRNFDLRPYAIIKNFDLQKPIYKQTAHGGHFGREGFPWEKIIDLSHENKKKTE